MKIFTKIAAAVLLSSATLAAQTSLFHENFDSPSGPDSVSTSSASGTAPILWNDTSFLSVSGNSSYHVSGSPGSGAAQQVFFETQSFSTVNQDYVYLRFSHIAKIFVQNEGRISISTDNGQTYTQLTSTPYRGRFLGGSTVFRSVDYFNEAGYNLPSQNVNLWNALQWTGPASVPKPSWWVEEAFDLTGLANDTSAGFPATGFANVKIRFEAQFNNQVIGTGGYLAGWFVDDVKVLGHNCELVPPRITTDFTPFPCYNHNPQGSVPTDSQNDYAVGVRAFDDENLDSGIDSLILFSSVNGSAFTATKMQLYQSFNNEYRSAVFNVMPGDSARYYIVAYDNCGNSHRLPNDEGDYFEFQPFNTPSKCGNGVGCNQSPSLITDFPWREDFEGPEWMLGNRGNNTNFRSGFPIGAGKNWTVQPSPNQDWGYTVWSGPTPQANTGPSADHTSGSGQYLFSDFEFAPASEINTLLITPCIDLRDSVPRQFSFWYHLFGADVDKLTIHIDTGSDAIALWPGYDEIVGEVQNRSINGWQQRAVDLSPFQGKIIRILIRKRRLPSGDLADMALDDFSIENIPPRDVRLLAVDSPSSSPCGATSGLPLAFRIVNDGNDSLGILPFAYQLNGGAIIRDTATLNGFGFLDTATIQSSAPLVLNPAQPHVLKVWTEVSGDSDTSDDTLSIPLSASGNAIQNFPYHLDFENATAGNPGLLNDSNWILNGAANSGGAHWKIEKGPLRKTLAGPFTAFGKEQTFVALQVPSGASASVARFESKCIDLTNANLPKLYFHGFEKNAQTLEVYVEDAGQWKLLPLTVNTFSQKETMKLYEANLTPYAGNTTRLAFEVLAQASDSSYHVAFDNIQILEGGTTDLALRSFPESLQRFFEGTTSLPAGNSFDFSVLRLPTSTTAQIKIEMENQCINQPTITATSPSFFVAQFSAGNLNRSQTINNLTLSASLTAGHYLGKAWLETPGDSVHFNDTLYFESSVIPDVAAPFFTDFENCDNGFSFKGPLRQWEIATPQKSGISGAFSGANAAVSNRSDSVVSTGEEFLFTPIFVGMDSVFGAEIRFRHNFDFIGGARGRVEVLRGAQGWTDLYTPNIQGQNWAPFYNYVSGSDPNNGFTGSSPGWILSTYPLAQLRPQPIIAFRFVLDTKGERMPGWAIDDFEIFVPEQNSASPTALGFTQVPLPSGNLIKLEITNTGAAPLSEAEIFVENNGQLQFSEVVNFSALQSGKSTVVTLATPLNLDTVQNQLLIYTQRPNDRPDELPLDDTLQLQFAIPGTVATLPFCADFDSSSTFLPFQEKTGFLGGQWEVAPAAAAPSAPNAWTIAPADSLSHLLRSDLYTPSYLLQAGPCYRFSFQHLFDTEKNFDGGNVEITLDSGQTWQVLGNFDDTAWYNSLYVQSLELTKPGFSGNSGGWVQSFQEFSPALTGLVQFRFRYATNASVASFGWLIDDVCVENIATGCEVVSLAENGIQGFKVFPNPAREKLNIVFEKEGDREIWITNGAGQKIRLLHLPEKENAVDVSAFPKGIYFLNIKTKNGETRRVKFLKN